MNENERYLLRAVCDGDIKKSRSYARIILNGITSQKDASFKDNLLRKLDTKTNLIELPYNLQSLLIAEDVTSFPEARYILRPGEEAVIKKVLSTLKASERLAELGISYLPTLMLHGASGGGKTMLARYIAYKTERPFIYVQFSNLVKSLLGETQGNIAKVFDYARTAPCVLCFDEIDAVGMKRGQKGDVGEMNRVVIALMQEMDRLPNDVIIIGTTNRFDRLDPALVRRFTIKHEVLPMSRGEASCLAAKFFRYTGIDLDDWFGDWFDYSFEGETPASVVVEKCTEYVVERIVREIEAAG